MTRTPTATWASDLRVLLHLGFTRVKGGSHGERLEYFYRDQSPYYDSFRARLLHGRDELFRTLEVQDGSLWVDLGTGTGENAARWGKKLERISEAYLVDLCPSLLHLAKQRIEYQRWQQLQPVLWDATTFCPDKPVDIVTFSYSLTMMPDWFAAIDNAFRMLKPGGQIGVVDFYVSPKHPPSDRAKHSWVTRTIWPAWFAMDNVYLSSDHLPYLQQKFETVQLHEERGSVPWLPLVRVPYYRFMGRKPQNANELD